MHSPLEKYACKAFVRGVWAYIPDTKDLSWVHQATAQKLDYDCAHGDRGTLIGRMLDAGISDYDIARFAKISSYLTAFGICSLFDDPEASFRDSVSCEYTWNLSVVDYDSNEPIPGLGPLDSVWTYLPDDDPTGREMHPDPDRG